MTHHFGTTVTAPAPTLLPLMLEDMRLVLDGEGVDSRTLEMETQQQLDRSLRVSVRLADGDIRSTFDLPADTSPEDVTAAARLAAIYIVTQRNPMPEGWLSF